MARPSASNASGARSISNIVDITNYVMFELGQPLHAFDADLLAKDASGKIAIGVRSAAEGEHLTTLDGQDRTLTADTLLITDPTGPVALAGVMGGESTEVHEGTVNVLLESACFNPGSISRTSRRLGLFSEASSRFEKAVDRASCVDALDRAAALMAELCGGQVAPGVVDTYPAPAVARELTLRHARLERTARVRASRQPRPRRSSPVSAARSPRAPTRSPSPSRRFGPTSSARSTSSRRCCAIHGMERITPTLPSGAGRLGELTREQRLQERIGATMRASGLNETMTYAFADPADIERMRDVLDEGEVYCELLNPMSAEQAVLRRTMIPGLLRSVSYNQRRGVPDVHLYEIGSTFRMAPGRKQPKERAALAGVLAGAWHRPAWNEPAEPLGFFDGKGVIETLARELGLKRFKVRATELPFLQPGRAAEVLVGGEVVGWLGEVHPLVLDSFEADGPVVAFELALAPLTRGAADAKPFADVPRFPAVDLDVASWCPRTSRPNA